jgi:hypothetical protein
MLLVLTVTKVDNSIVLTVTKVDNSIVLAVELSAVKINM